MNPSLNPQNFGPQSFGPQNFGPMPGMAPGGFSPNSFQAPPPPAGFAPPSFNPGGFPGADMAAPSFPQDTASFNAPAPPNAGTIPGGDGGQPSDAEIQALLQQIMGDAGALGGAQGAPNGAPAPGGLGLPNGKSSMIQQGGMVLETNSSLGGGGGLLANLLNPKFLLGAAALLAGGVFLKKKFFSGETLETVKSTLQNVSFQDYMGANAKRLEDLQAAVGDAVKVEALKKEGLEQVEEFAKRYEPNISGIPDRIAASNELKSSHEALYQHAEGLKQGESLADAVKERVEKALQGFHDLIAKEG